MSETVPAPAANPDLAGHESAERRLLDAWASGRLPHGWLITGPQGIGKATLAYRFARFVFAHPAPGADDGPGLFGDAPAPPPDGLHLAADHPVFRRVASGGHADLHVVERRLVEDKRTKRLRLQTVISVENVREAIHAMAMTAGEGGWRIVVIDGAEDMNPSAANALLKVLEEPPPRALLLLVSHAAGRLLPTIRSRCCHLRLAPLAAATVDGLLATYRPDLDDGDRALLARLANGSVGRALALADGDGIAIQRELLALMGSMPGLDIAAAQKFAERFTRRDTDAAWRTATDLMGRTVAAMVSAGARGGDPAADGYGAAEADCFRRLHGLASLDRWAEVWEKTGHLFARADGVNLDRKEVMLTALGLMESVARKGA